MLIEAIRHGVALGLVLIIGCGGLWDVMTSQCAMTMVRKELMQHNDPERCAFKRASPGSAEKDSSHNLTVVVICFSSNPPPSK